MAAIIRPVVIRFTDQIFVTSKPCEARHNNNNNIEYRGEERPSFFPRSLWGGEMKDPRSEVGCHGARKQML